jgi:hypothetical protein
MMGMDEGEGKGKGESKSEGKGKGKGEGKGESEGEGKGESEGEGKGERWRVLQFHTIRERRNKENLVRTSECKGAMVASQTHR